MKTRQTNLTCSIPGCCRRWVTNIDRRRCHEHDERRPITTLREAVEQLPSAPRHWQETARDWEPT